MGVANGGTSHSVNATSLPFPQLSSTARQAHSFTDFPHSLMSVGKTADDGTVSIITKDGVIVHRESKVLITCQGKPIFVGVRDEQGHYCIPLMATEGAHDGRGILLGQANSVYDLPPSGCTQSAATQSSQRGSRPSKQVTTSGGLSLPPTTS